jgi:hypothetical protein
VRPARLRAVVLFAMAGAGLVGGHLLGYVFAVPDARARRAVLAWSGHGYLSKALLLAVASALLAGFAAAILGTIRIRGRNSLRFGDLAVRLSVLQSTGFLVLEVCERLLAGVPVSDLWGPVVALGVPLQALVAVVGALALLAIARVAEVVARALAPSPPGSNATVEVSPNLPRLAPPRPHVTSRVTRGPPTAVAA